MVWNKSTTTVVVSMGVLLTIGAMLVATPSAYAESTCIGACKNRGDVDQSTSTTNNVENNIDNSQSTTNNIDNSICRSATVPAPNSCRIA
jgi:hypothetical protein